MRCTLEKVHIVVSGNAGLDEFQAGIKITRRNVNNLIMQMTPPLWQKVKRNYKEPFDESEREE